MTQRELRESASDVKSKQIFEFLSVLSIATYVRVRMEVKVYSRVPIVATLVTFGISSLWVS